MIVILAASQFGLAARAAERQVVHGHVPAAVARLQAIGNLPGTNRLNLAIGLPLRNREALTNLLRELYDPTSPKYHHYLTPEQFAEQFGPTEQDYQAVMAFARANGLHVTATHPNRILLDVNGSVADVERALHVTLRVYQHPKEKRTFHAPDTEPSLDLTVPVLQISGLDDYALPRPRLTVTRLSDGQSAVPNAGSGPGGGYMGKDFRAAYAPGMSLNGSGQTVGLLQFDGYTASDITYYESLAGLPNITLSNVLIDGASGLPSGSGGEVEVSLDIEMAISMATNISKVMVYMAPNPSPWVDLLNRMVTDNAARQLSCSWYQPGGGANAVTDQIFQQMAAQGQSFFNASGDYDAYTGLIDFPGDTPYITQVGGTTLTTSGAGGSWVSETVWNRGNGIGSGGGISTQYPIPGWQTNVNMSGNQGSTTMRNTPDVALTAENVYVRADGVNYTVGGTSCAAPLWAGFAALVNQQAAATGQSPVGFINPAIYALGARPGYTNSFHDTTTGNNTSSSSPSRFYAAAGYDLCTGWGTPAGQGLVNALVAGIVVTVPASATEGDGVLAGAGQVRLPAAQTTNVTVSLASSDTAQVTVPSTATILAGQTNVAFNLTILDDGILDGTQIATITASTPGFGTGSANMNIFDKETATLHVLLPATATEGQGTVTGTVQVSAVVGANVAVGLSSSDTTEIQVPATMTIPAGQTSAVFTATVVDDNQIDGSQNATVTAHVQNWTDGSASITVLDNENTNLTVVLPAQISEGAGVLTNAGQVVLSGTLTNNLTVSLVSSDPTRLIVPATATVLAGQTNGFFNLTPVDNSVPDGSHTVTVIATAFGFRNGTNSVTILDDDADHFTFSVIASPQNVSVPFAVTITARDATNGLVIGFQKSLTLSAAGAHGAVAFTPTNTGPFTAGQWSGSLTMNATDTNVVLTASDGSGHTGTSNPFNVLRPVSTFIPAASRVDMVPDAARGLLYITAGNQVLRYDLNAGTFLSPFVFGSSLCGIDISPDNNTLVVADTAAYNDSNVWVYVVNLPTGTNYQANFPRAFYEGGTYAVAFGYDGAAVITSTFLGSGWVPMRRYDPVSGNVTTVANPRHNSMVSASGDGRTMGVAEADISNGPLDRYDVASQTITGGTGDGWFNFEVGVNRNGSQFAVPTYGGTYIYDTNLNQTALVGTYASEGPIGLAYAPQADLVFFAWWPTSFIRAYETHTMTEVARYDCGYSFGWVGNSAFQQGRLRVSRDGINLFVTVSGGVRWISRPVGAPADLALTQTNSPNPVDAGNNLTYTITVTNKGPNGVTDAKVFDLLPAGVTFVSATASQGTCTLSNGLVTCSLGVVPNAGASVSIVVVPLAGGIVTNTAVIVSSAADPNPDNNAAVQLTTVRVGVLGVAPPDALAAAGPVGGPFSPAVQTYVLTNGGDASLVWNAAKNADWLTLSAPGGTLAPGATANVTVSINGIATGLTRGVYSDTILFTNVTTGLGSDTRAVTLTVNSAPVASPQTVTVLEDGSSVITLQGTDVDHDALTAIVTALPAHGTLYQTADGINPTTPITSVPATVSNPANKVIFALGQHGYGNDYGDFTFKVNDGLADSADALVAVNVTHVNHAPVAANDSVAFLVGTTNVPFNVLVNDADVDGDALTVQSFTVPTRGTLTQTNNGGFIYRPNAAFTNGQDQFSYTIADGQGGTATAQVTIKAYTQLLIGGDWPTFGNGPSHTGYYPAMLGGATLVAGWSTNFGSALNQVAVGGGNLYVTPIVYFGTTYLTALNAISGQAAWQYNFNSAFSINPPTYDSGRVYVQRGDAGSDTQLWSLDAASGNVIWSAPFGAQWERYYAPTVVGTNVWVDGGYYGGMYGFGTNGVQRFFNSALEQYDQWTPTYYQGTVYSWVAGNFRAHDPLTGAVLWMASFGWNWDGWSMNTVSAIDGGRAFVQQRPNLIAIDLTTHTNAWTVTGGVKGSPAVANGIVYAIIGDGVQAFSAQNGTSLGIYEATNDTGVAWQPIVTDDALFISSPSATYVFNLASHQLVQTIPFGGPLSLANGWLYIAGQDGWLRAYTVPNTNPPAIFIQPAGQTATAGSAVTFNVTAFGGLPLSYQWQFNGTNLGGATNVSLTLSNVQMSQAGNYAVLVTNAYGSALSSNALLTVYADHYAWNPIPSPQGTNVPFLVTLLAQDATNGTMIGYTNSVTLAGMATNRPGTNFDFEAGTLAPWTPLNTGSSPGPYQLVTYDVNGDGKSSTAFAIEANSGTPDGITQNIQLTGGLTYTVDMDIATDDTGGGNNADGGTTAIQIGGTTVAQFGWGYVSYGQIYRTNLHGTYTPSTSGTYAVTLTFYRGYGEAGGLWCLADDLRIIGPGGPVAILPTLSGNFTNGVWSGTLVALNRGTNVVLTADDGHGHRGVSNPFNILSTVAPFILVQPANCTVLGGSNVTFAVGASGTPPLSYLWQKNGAPLARATNVSLVLTNVTRTNSGTYTVVVTNLAGSITSSNAVLLVHVPQRLGVPVLLPNGTLVLTSGDMDGGTISASYLTNLQAQASSNLVNWVTLPGSLTLTNGMLRLQDSGSTNLPRRFYRIIENW